MATIDEALAELKTILATVDPSPQPAPTAVYIYPDDYQSAVNATVPFITVEQVVNAPFRWSVGAKGRGVHTWDTDIRIFLHPGQLTRDSDIKAAAAKQKPWLQAIATLLFSNMSLNGKADIIGGARLDGNSLAGNLFEYRIGHMTRGADTSVFWGIGLRLPITQSYAQTMQA